MTASPTNPHPPWHTLLGPLPPDAIPQRTPIASQETLALPEASSIAGWEQLTLVLSAGAAGLRAILVVLDETGRAISASDMVLYRSPPAAPAEGPKDPGVFMRQRSIGGRFEPDGTFTGTSWHTEGPEPLEGEEPNWVSTPSKPTEEDVEALAELVAEVMRRQPEPEAY